VEGDLTTVVDDLSIVFCCRQKRCKKISIILLCIFLFILRFDSLCCFEAFADALRRKNGSNYAEAGHPSNILWRLYLFFL